MRTLLFVIGIIAVGLGIIGIFLPLLPTTPFMLLATACFARSSDRFYQWIINHPTFGHTIQHYRAGRGIPKKAKVMALTLMWLSITSSALFVSMLWLQVLLICIAIAVSYYLLSLPTA